eukprot:TRINITY_DN13061_c0_g2_i1.p1 TRINITY_DN13061_c0_g2~~TRINITY_DN13061_c0_g2_i1.p1  ORF type:complete len:399 (-),score=60.26 TRINITY_DN13061_c0_g2_i1:274-1383(-)
MLPAYSAPALKPLSLASGAHALVYQRGSVAAHALPQDSDAHNAFFGRREVARLTGGMLAGALAATARMPRARADGYDVPAASIILDQEFECGGLKLQGPRSVGGGVQAQVFAAELGADGAAKEVAVKVARLETDYARQTLQREKMILDKLRAAAVPGVVSCLAIGDLSCAIRNKSARRSINQSATRNALVLDPFLASARNFSVKAGRLTPIPEQAERARMDAFFETALAVLDAGVAGVDVQVLVQKDTNKLLWIDFTEAALLPPTRDGSVTAPAQIRPEYEQRYKSADAAVLGFATEVFLMVPVASQLIALESLKNALEVLRKKPARGSGAVYQGVWGALPWWGDTAPPPEGAAEALQALATAATGKAA